MFKVDDLKEVFELAATAGTFINELMKIKSNCKNTNKDNAKINSSGDFTKPENFVRLFDLTLPQKGIPTIAEFVTYEHLTITDSKDFLAKLIEMLKDDSYVADIKQSIREAEWVYG